jgi:hypothetical protein
MEVRRSRVREWWPFEGLSFCGKVNERKDEMLYEAD